MVFLGSEHNSMSDADDVTDIDSCEVKSTASEIQVNFLFRVFFRLSSCSNFEYFISSWVCQALPQHMRRL